MRLSRFGAKKQPYYRVVIADSRSPRNDFIDQVGTYNPLGNECRFDTEKAKEWLKNGAQPTETVKSLLKKAGVTE